jgi:putative peptidoglycan lipid II flippase
VGFLSFVVSAVVGLKDVIVAAIFGTTNDMDAFLIAILLPTFVISIVATSFNAALIPVYIEVRDNEGPEAAQRLFSGITLLTVGLLTLTALLLAGIGPVILPLIASGFSASKMNMTMDLFYILVLIVVVSGLCTVWGAVLNAGERFAWASMSNGIVPVSSIVFLIVFGRAWGISALACGVVVGFVLQAVFLGIGLRRRGLSLRLRWPGFTGSIRRVLGQYLPMVVGSAIMGGSPLIDQSMAAILRPGSVAALNYGEKVVTLVLTVGTMALSTAVLPFFSKMAAQRDWPGMRHSVTTYSRLILLVTIPFTLLVCLFSEPIVRIIFQRGQFTEADTTLVSQVQIMFLLQVPFFTLGILFVRLISSLQANYILMWGTMISFTVNIVFNYLLMQLFGVAGIALSTTIVYVVACLFLSRMFYRKMRTVEGQPG